MSDPVPSTLEYHIEYHITTQGPNRDLIGVKYYFKLKYMAVLHDLLITVNLHRT
jgi:hypothetical protein